MTILFFIYKHLLLYPAISIATHFSMNLFQIDQKVWGHTTKWRC